MLLALLLACAPVAPQPAASGVTYLVPVASFQDSDGDGVGDLVGVRSRIDHLVNLGVQSLQLMPLEPGCDPGRLLPCGEGLDPALGDPQDLAALAEALHAHGIRLEVQIPMDAVGLAHPWVNAARHGEGRIQIARRPAAGWFPFGRGLYYYAPEDIGAPELDWDERSLVADRLRALAVWTSVDGLVLRPFASEGARTSLDIAIDLLHAVEGRVSMTTTPTDPGALVAWAALGPVVDHPRATAYASAAVDQDFSDLRQVLADWGDAVDRTRPFLGDGDGPRLATRVANAVLRRTLLTIHLLGPGAPTLYYGEELDLPDATTLPVDEPWRAPMPWDRGPACGFTRGEPWFQPDPACKVGWNVADEEVDPESMLHHVRWLAAVRAAWAGAHAIDLDTGLADVLAFQTGQLCVVGSASEVERAMILEGCEGVDLRTGEQVYGDVEVEPRGWRVIKRGRPE